MSGVYASALRLLQRLGSVFGLLWLPLVVFLVWAANNLLLFSQRAEQTPGDHPTITLTQAEVFTQAGVRTVELPHKLQARDHRPEGSMVHYRLRFELPAPPHHPLAILVHKVSLSGAFFLNGEAIGQCENGALHEVRCLHRPHMLSVPGSLWREGENTLDIDVWANRQQLNGLSAVQIGDPVILEQTAWGWRQWLQVDVVLGLTWIALLMGLTSVSISLAMPEEKIYRWFGWTCLAYTLSNLNLLVTQPAVSPEVFSWLVFVSRMWCIPLAYVLVISFFGKDAPWMGRLALVYCLCAGVLLALLPNNRSTAIALYLVLLPGVPAFSVLMPYWTWRRPSARKVGLTCVMLIMFGCGIYDMLRLTGMGPFTGVYLLTYGYAGVLLIMGGIQLELLISALAQARRRGDALQLRVDQRNDELEQAQRTIEHMQKVALTITKNISVGTYVLETDTFQQPRFTFVSDRFLEMLDVSREEVMAKPALGFRWVHPDDSESFLALNLKVFSSMESFHWEGRIVVRGEVRWLRIESVARPLGAGACAWEGAMIDITDQKRTGLALEKANEMLLAHEIERTRQEERERLLQDMHDGFGSQLASARLLAERGEMTQTRMAQILHECMADLYLVIDTLGHHSTLAAALADFRFRTEQRLAGHDLQMLWELELDDASSPAQSVVLHLLRILQEAIHNALRHSGAQQIRISARHDLTLHGICLRVSDNGRGLPGDAAQGRGLNNMRHRAREIGAQLDVRDRADGQGTVVEVLLPWPKTA